MGTERRVIKWHIELHDCRHSREWLNRRQTQLDYYGDGNSGVRRSDSLTSMYLKNCNKVLEKYPAMIKEARTYSYGYLAGCPCLDKESGYSFIRRSQAIVLPS
jgi:hypothetical protein